jgi:hypothetical protein
MRVFSDFIKNITKLNVGNLLEDKEFTDFAIQNLKSDNDRILKSTKEWFTTYSDDPYEESISDEDPYFYTESIESQLINILNENNQLSYDHAQKIRKVSLLANESRCVDGGNEYWASIPIEITFNSPEQNTKFDKIKIDANEVNELLKKYKLVSDNDSIQASNHLFWAVSYPAHIRSEYMSYLMERIDLNALNNNYSIKPVRSNSYMYKGIYPKYMREYFITIKITTQSKTNPILQPSELNQKLFGNSLTDLVNSSNKNIKDSTIHSPTLISESFLLLEKLSAKTFISENLLPLIEDRLGSVGNIPVYIRTSSMDNQKPYSKNPECFIDMAIPNINTKPHHQNKGDPVMSMKCDNSVQVIELLEGINLLREEIEKKIKGKFIFSTAQYEYGRGSVIYSSNNDFHSSYSVFKDCVDFYYYDDSTTNQSSDLDFHSELIPFPTKDN